jgi:WD40 repeat protein
MNRRNLVVVPVLFAVSTAFCNAMAPAPALPEDGPLPPAAVARIGDSRRAPNVMSQGGYAFSPDGKQLAAFGPNGVLYIWDVATGRPARRFVTGKDWDFDELAWSPNAKTIARWWGGDGGLCFLDAETGKEFHHIDVEKHKDLYMYAAFSPDSKSIVWTSSNGVIHLYNLDAKKEVQKWSGDAVRFAFSPDGKTLVTGTGDSVTVINLTTGKEVVRFEVKDAVFGALAVSPDSKTLAVGYAHGVRLYDLTQGKDAVARDTEHPDLYVMALCFSPDGKTLVSGTNVGKCIVWDIAAKKTQRQFHVARVKDSYSGAHYPVFTPDGKTLAWTHDDDYRIHLTDVATGAELHRPEGKPLPRRIAFAHDGKHLVAPCYDGKLRIWDATTGKVVRAFDKECRYFRQLVLSRDGKNLVGIGDVAVVWDTESGKVMRKIEFTEGETDLCAVGAISADGKTLAMGEYTFDSKAKERICQVRWVEIETGKVLNRSSHGGFLIFAIAFAPDGKGMASLDYLFNLYLWDATKGKEVAKAEHPADPADQIEHHLFSEIVLAYSTDGKKVLFGQNMLVRQRSQIIVRAADSGKELSSFFGPAGSKFCAFSADGERIAWFDKSNTVVITDIRGDKKVAELKGHQGQIQQAAFSADGKRLATSSADGTILIWDIARAGKQ